MLRIVRLAIAALLLGCGASASPAAAPATVRPLPHAGAADPELAAFGRELHAALAAGRPVEVLLADGALSALFRPEAEQRWLAMRARTPGPGRLDEAERQQWLHTRFAELCVQQGRVEPAGGALGLRASGFVFERALLVGRDAGGGALASWIEGVFLYTDAGFTALAIERIETPRPDHSDLELAVCELRARDERPNP